MTAGSRPSRVHHYVSLAIEAITVYVRDFHVLTPPASLIEQYPDFHRRAGVFVSLKKRGELRGCMGTIEPAKEFLALEIVENALNAASQDPRFPRVEEGELPHLTVSVDVLSTPERVAGPEDLDIRRYGVIVRFENKRGLLLPDIDGIRSVEEQVAVARRKAGIGELDPVELYRFEVERFF